MEAKQILILGATSSIARAAAMAFAAQGHTLYLAARDRIELERISTDIHIRYQTPVHYSEFDIENVENYECFFEKVRSCLPQLAGIVFAIGILEGEISKILEVNFNKPALFLEMCAPYFEQQKSGFIIGISSCAGDRGRQSNYIYGAAKGGLNIYLQGLRHRLYKHNVQVITIKPGFVDTQMTFGLPGVFLAADPQSIGQAIVAAPYQKRDVVYLPWFWRYIMTVIRHMPEFIFKRTSL